MRHDLNGPVGAALSDFRIGASVKGPTLGEARRLVDEAGFLEPSYWLHRGIGKHSRYEIAARIVSKDDMMDNAGWVYDQAASKGIFKGRGEQNVTRRQIQALTDIFNALGWYNGLHRPSKFTD